MTAAIQRWGRRVHGWPLRTAEQMLHAVRVGVDGTAVDDPQAAVEWYEQALAAKA